MILKGKTYQWDEVLPFTKVMVVDALGFVKQPVNGVTSDINGDYSITVNSSDYILARGSGMRDKKIKVSEVCTQNNCNFDIKLEGMYKDVEEVTVVGNRPVTPQNPTRNWNKIALITGLSVLGVVAIIFGISKLNK
jgi:hypothetical protein